MKIKQKLIALFLFIGLAPTLAVSSVAYITISNELQAKTSEQLNSIAIKQEQKINSLLQKKQEEVSKLANTYDFQVSLGNYLESHKAGDHATIAAILQAKQIEISEIQAIYVADPTDGTVIASTIDNTEGQKLQKSDYAITDGNDTAVNVREDQRDGINKLYITTNISVNKKEAAVMNVVFRIDDIVATIQDYTGLGTTGETIVASKEGNNTVSLFPLRFDTDAALNTKLNSLNLSASDSYRTATDYRGHAVMIATRSAGFANWVVATKMDRQEVLAPINQLRNSLIGIFVVSSIAIILIANYFARFFTNPILQIARTSQRIGQGDFSAHSDIQRGDEIGELSNSVNTMGLSLSAFVSRIEAERNRLSVVLNSTAESIVAIDKQGTVIIANQAAAPVTGRGLHDIVDKNISELFAWQHQGKPFDISYTTDGRTTYPDLKFIDAAGDEHFVKVQVARVVGEQEQRAAQTIVTIHDETKSRELEDMKIDFVSMAAHELRTPLAAIRGYLELVSFKDRTLQSSTAGYIRQALKSATELGGLINNLLDVTRIERGTLTLNMEKVDLAATIAQAVTDMQFSANDKRIKLDYAGPANNCSVVADQIALREVINNLLINAVKYTPEGGSISVNLDMEQGSYVVRVKDSGIGIPQKALPNLFTKFYRVHGGLDSGSTGTGLGLFISKSIMERHNGMISVASEVGKGSTFTFSLPILDETHLASVQSEQQSQEQIMRRHRGWVTKNITR